LVGGVGGVGGGVVGVNASSLQAPFAPKGFAPRVSYIQDDETLSRNSLKYLSKASSPVENNQELQGTF